MARKKNLNKRTLEPAIRLQLEKIIVYMGWEWVMTHLLETIPIDNIASVVEDHFNKQPQPPVDNPN